MTAWWVADGDLDEDQLAVFNADLGPSDLILGPPGSGKTNLLLLRAEQLSRSGSSHLRVVVFNRTLQEFIRHGVAPSMVLPPANIVTHVKFMQDLLDEHNVPRADVPTDFAEMRHELATRVLEVIDEEHLAETYPTLLLDEIQDYSELEIQIFRRLAKTLVAAGDVRQRIFDVKVKPELIKANFDRVFQLRYHYRNGSQICRLADALRVPPVEESLVENCRYKEEDKPSTVRDNPKLPRLEDQCQVMVPELQTQLRAYPGELLGVISARTEDIDTIAALLAASPVADKVLVQRPGRYQAYDPLRPIWLCGLQSAKGLEFRAVHLLASDRIRNMSNLRSKTYMAVTRAKTSLSVHSADARLGFLEDALFSLRDPVPRPSLSDILPTGTTPKDEESP